jgi:hypothetical protein
MMKSWAVPEMPHQPNGVEYSGQALIGDNTRNTKNNSFLIVSYHSG